MGGVLGEAIGDCVVKSSFPSSREESQVGDKMAVVTVGQLSVQGTFWVRILPDARQQQVVMLQSISTAIGWVSCDPLVFVYSYVIMCDDNLGPHGMC